jgi:hypothetical protein
VVWGFEEGLRKGECLAAAGLEVESIYHANLGIQFVLLAACNCAAGTAQMYVDDIPPPELTHKRLSISYPSPHPLLLAAGPAGKGKALEFILQELKEAGAYPPDGVQVGPLAADCVTCRCYNSYKQLLGPCFG